MDYTDLPNKPLIESIFEFKWELVKQDDGTTFDPFYQILVGQFFGKISKRFPNWNNLQPPDIPFQIPYSPQHQFRIKENSWPLVQIGPGVITVNDTGNYKWKVFRGYCNEICKAFLSVYPEPDKLNITDIRLRYLNADLLAGENPYSFMKKLKINIFPPDALFLKGKVSDTPHTLNTQLGFETIDPKGFCYLKAGTGKKASSNEPALVWETGVVSLQDNAPDFSNVLSWLDSAHEITHNWFLGLSEGELLEKYNAK